MDPIEKSEKMARLRAVAPQERVLLLPHCLRRSAHCQARYERDTGLQCAHCDEECPIHRILTVAEENGLGGICVAPGGSMAIEYLKKRKPLGILAVACPKELSMGVEAVLQMSRNGWNPVVVTVGLSQDGCVDTEVDVDLVAEFVKL